MDESQLLEVSREAMFVMLKISAPIMLAGLAIGVLISLFQALTHIQEMTLTFVPKILVTFTMLLMLLPFMFNTLKDFMQLMMDYAAHGI